MALAADVTESEAEPVVEQRRRPWLRALPALPALLAAAVVAVAVSPVVVGGLSFVGDTWHPAGDWTHFIYRVSQVGTRETPLVGSYTVKGWAHPGPLGFWVAAPLYRLTGSDPRALQWTAALVNVAAIAGLAVVAWRRGRWPLLLGVTALAAVLVHGIGPRNLVDLWNPYLPLTSFLLVIFLAWDAALGRRAALVVAVLPATLAMQSHLAFVSLVGLLVVWLYAWARWWPRLIAPDGVETAELPRPPWAPWWASVRRGLALGVVLWLAPLFDAVFDLHNPWNIAKSFGSGAPRVGLVEAIGLVGRYVRPDGPWMGGPEPIGANFFSVQGSGALPLLVAVAALVGCLQLARRYRLVDAAALATLALTLVIGAIPATAQIPLPNETYLMQWLKLVGGVAWFTVAWTGWRLVESRVRAGAASSLRVGALGVTAAVLVAGAASSWREASHLKLPLNDRGAQVEDVVAQLEEQLPRDQTIRVARRGEFFHVYAAGVFYQLVRDGYDVVTDEGGAGLKWGHSHRWTRGEPYDLLITVAINQASDACAENPDARPLASYDGLSPEDRAWLRDVQFRRLGGPDAVTPAEVRRADRLAPDDIRIGVYEGSRPCAPDIDNEVTRSSDSSILPVALGGTALVVIGGGLLLRRRRRRSKPEPEPEAEPESEREPA